MDQEKFEIRNEQAEETVGPEMGDKKNVGRAVKRIAMIPVLILLWPVGLYFVYKMRKTSNME